MSSLMEQTLDQLHPSHVTKISDAGSFDTICVNCNNTDSFGSWGLLALQCANEPEEHWIARLLDSSQEFIDSTTK